MRSIRPVIRSFRIMKVCEVNQHDRSQEDEEKKICEWHAQALYDLIKSLTTHSELRSPGPGLPSSVIQHSLGGRGSADGRTDADREPLQAEVAREVERVV